MHRTFGLRMGEQGSDYSVGDWVIPVDAEGRPLDPKAVDEFKRELLGQLSSHLDSCMSNGYWMFEVSSSDWED